jgi:hypothetical protein
MEREDAPAPNGEVRIASIRGLGGHVLYRWPIDQGDSSPDTHLLLRVLDSGDWYIAIEEDWD